MTHTAISVVDLSSFIHLVLMGFIALFPVFNPIGTAFVINPFFEGVDQKQRTRYVRRITLMTFYFGLIIIFLGHLILELFGISVAVVRVSGGLVIFMLGWNMLSGKGSNEDESEHAATDSSKGVESKLLYPITFPMTAGAGVISVLLTLSSHTATKHVSDYLLNVSAIILSLVMICVLIFFMYANTNRIIETLGEKNKVVVNKIFAFLIMCVGAEIVSAGLTELFK